jgi:hypothetical protein
MPFLVIWATWNALYLLPGGCALLKRADPPFPNERDLVKFAKSFAALMIAGLLPLAAASSPASAEVFDWSLTGPSPDLGGVPFPGSGTITATPTGSTGVFAIDTITGMVNGSDITGTSTFDGADNLLFTNGFAFVSTSGISFETAAGQIVNIFSFFGQETSPTGNAYGELTSNPGAFGVGTFTLTAVPEASTWAMMLIGFAGLGIAGYRVAQKPAVAAA